MGRRRIFAGVSRAVLAGAVLVVAGSAGEAWTSSPPVREIRGDDAPPCRGSACDPSPPAAAAVAVPPPAALNVACGVQMSGRECRLNSGAIPACSAAANEAFELAMREQAGARVDPTLTRTNALGIASVDRDGGTPSYAWTPAFSTKKTSCGKVVDVEQASGGVFWGPANDERVRVLPSARFEPLRAVAAGLADEPSSRGCRDEGRQPDEACLDSAVTPPGRPSAFLPAKDTTHCAFGPVVNAALPSWPGGPEIHPLQTQWWAPRPGRLWLIKGSQDGSQRFTVAGWAAPRRCPSFTCDPPPDAWRNFAARALPHAVEIAFELDLRETQGASFNLTTLEDDNTSLTAADADWGTGKDRDDRHDLFVDERLLLQVDEGHDGTSHVDFRDLCRNGALLRGYLRVAFITGSAPVLEDASGRRYGRKTIQVARRALGASPPRVSQAESPRAVRLGARAPRWNAPSIHDDVGVRQDLRSWREGYRLVGIKSPRSGSIPFREVTPPTRALDWVDAAVLPDFDLLRDRGPLTFLFAERDRSYSLTVGWNPPRPTFDLVRENALRVADTDAAPAMVRLAGGAANSGPALTSLYDVVRYSSLDLRVRPGYVDANTPEDTDLSGALNHALNTPAEARVKVFGSATPFKAAWRLRAHDAETRAELPVREGRPDGSATVFTAPGEPDGLTEGASLRLHFPDLQGRIVDMTVEVTLTDAAGQAVTRQFQLLSHVGWIRSAAGWEALRRPLGTLAAVKLDEVARDAGLLNGTAQRAAVLANAPPRLFHADALWTFASRTGLAHSRLEVGTLRRLIDLARNYARSAATN